MTNPPTTRLAIGNNPSQCALLTTALTTLALTGAGAANAEPETPPSPWSANATATAAVDGANTSTEPSGRASIALELAAAWTDTASRITDGDPDPKDCCLFVYHTVDPEEIEGVGGNLRVELSGQGPADPDADVVLDEELFARIAGWNATQWARINRTPDFRDAFWRSGRGQLELGIDLETPPMWALGDPRSLVFSVFALRVGYAELISTGDLATSNYDIDIRMVAAALHHRRFALSLFPWRYREWGVPLAKSGETTLGVSVGAFDIHMAKLDLHLGNVELSATGGLMFAFALAPFESDVGPGGGSSRSFGDPVTTGALWLSAQTEMDRLELELGGGTMTRISPDGYAVDVGGRVELAAALQLEAGDREFALELSLDGARARRQDVSDMAPAEIAPVGTVLWLGRATAGLSVPIRDGFSVGASVYAEHSDRDDPRRHAVANSDIESSFGVELTATMALHE